MTAQVARLALPFTDSDLATASVRINNLTVATEFTITVELPSVDGVSGGYYNGGDLGDGTTGSYATPNESLVMAFANAIASFAILGFGLTVSEDPLLPGRYTFLRAGGNEWEILWDDAATTMPPEWLGFTSATYASTSSVITAVHQSDRLWRATRPTWNRQREHKKTSHATTWSGGVSTRQLSDIRIEWELKYSAQVGARVYIHDGTIQPLVDVVPGMALGDPNIALESLWEWIAARTPVEYWADEDDLTTSVYLRPRTPDMLESVLRNINAERSNAPPVYDIVLPFVTSTAGAVGTGGGGRVCPDESPLPVTMAASISLADDEYSKEVVITNPNAEIVGGIVTFTGADLAECQSYEDGSLATDETAPDADTAVDINFAIPASSTRTILVGRAVLSTVEITAATLVLSQGGGLTTTLGITADEIAGLDVAGVQAAAGFEHIYTFDPTGTPTNDSGSVGTANLTVVGTWTNAAPTATGTLGSYENISAASGNRLHTAVGAVNVARTSDVWWEGIFDMPLSPGASVTAMVMCGNYNTPQSHSQLTWDVSQVELWSSNWSAKRAMENATYFGDPTYVACWWDHAAVTFRIYWRKVGELEGTDTIGSIGAGSAGLQQLFLSGNGVNINTTRYRIHNFGIKRGTLTSGHRNSIYAAMGII